MELRLEPELSAKVEQWSAQTGRSVSDLVEDAVATYLTELGELREKLDSRYDDIVSGKVQLVHGDEAYRMLKDRASARRKSIA
jgi:predicted DNA-binding protein